MEEDSIIECIICGQPATKPINQPEYCQKHWEDLQEDKNEN